MRASPSRADRSIKTFSIIGLISLALLLSCESLPFASKPTVNRTATDNAELKPKLAHVVDAFDPWSRDRGDYYEREAGLSFQSALRALDVHISGNNQYLKIC